MPIMGQVLLGKRASPGIDDCEDRAAQKDQDCVDAGYTESARCAWCQRRWGREGVKP